MPVADEIALMKRALGLARRGAGRVSPNPLVGAVVCRNGRIIGEGYHLYETRRHAEVVALDHAGSEAAGADLYVNLEPCCHHGRTPPCVDRIVSAGVRRVFVSIRDPNPQVNGKGVALLRQAGVEVIEGLCSQDAAVLNEKFLHFVRTGLPFVLLKLALSLDGRIATSSGDSRWITGPAARRHAHRLRFEYDAMLVGINTVLRDDPSLNVRWRRSKRVLRVILDSRLRTPPTARLFDSGDPVIIFHALDVDDTRAKHLAAKATLARAPVAQPSRLRSSENASLPWTASETPTPQSGGDSPWLRAPSAHLFLDWEFILSRLAEDYVTSLLIEGGGKVAASALRAGVVQKVNFLYAPKIIGAEGAPGVGDLGMACLAQALELDRLKVRLLPPDVLVEAYFRAS
jgi:diaminohydroxyphosphoribosylaminopyrimidine deaminase/5-amino-6-(5-phosphoribosylamino)uracil reductase